jgi:integrase
VQFSSGSLKESGDPAQLNVSSVYRHWYKRFAKAMSRAKVHQISFHELRHTFGTQMAAAGAPLRAIQEWMGHADAKTTEIYAHYAPDRTGGATFAERAFGKGRGLPDIGLTDDISDIAVKQSG